MVFSKSAVLLSLVALGFTYPIRREVPQEHSHEAILTVVRTQLNLNNPDGIQDPVFGLLGNAAATAGLGKISDPDCLQMATADQAFTNAKAAGDVAGMTAALQYRAIERNTGKVGLASVACTKITPKNPEIAALAQHQDPASADAASVNKAIVLELAKQIATIGGDPLDALKTGTFKPGDVADATAKGNTCDDPNDAAGCIFTQNLIVEDATADEINAAVSGISAASGSSNSTDTSATATASAAASSTTESAAAASGTICSLVPVTVTVTVADDATSAAPAATSVAASSAAAATPTAAAAASGNNLQTFTGNLGGAPPAIKAGGKGFIVNGSEFLNIGAAKGRSCDVQHNACANAANSGGSFSVGDCDAQNDKCKTSA